MGSNKLLTTTEGNLDSDTEYLQTHMNERNPDKKRDTSFLLEVLHRIMQRLSCPCRIKLPIRVLQQVCVYIAGHLRRLYVTDRPHCGKHPTVSSRKYSRCQMNCLIRQFFISSCRRTS